MKLLRNIHLGILNWMNGNGESFEMKMQYQLSSFLPLLFESRPSFGVSIATFELEIHQKHQMAVATIFFRQFEKHSHYIIPIHRLLPEIRSDLPLMLHGNPR